MLCCWLTVAVSVPSQLPSYSTMGGDKQLDRAKGDQDEASLSHPDSTQKTDSPGVCTGQDPAPKLPPPPTSSPTCTDMPQTEGDRTAAEIAIRKGDGWAPIKSEFIRPREEIIAQERACREKNGGAVKICSTGGSVDSSAEDRKKGKRGRNKKRPKDDRPAHAETLCSYLSVGRECLFGSSCRFSHDVKAYLEKKGPDIGDKCPIWDVRGSCPSGLKCRFGNAHTDPETLKPITRAGKADPSDFDHINDLSRELQVKLRRNEVPFACDRKGWVAFLASLDSDYPEPRSPKMPSTMEAVSEDPDVGSLAAVGLPDATGTDVTATVGLPDATGTDVTATAGLPEATGTDVTATVGLPDATGTDIKATVGLPDATGTDVTATVRLPGAISTDVTATVGLPDATGTDVTATVGLPDATGTDVTEKNETVEKEGEMDSLIPLAKRSRCEGFGDVGSAGILTSSSMLDEEVKSGSLQASEQEPQRTTCVEEEAVKARMAVGRERTNGNIVNPGSGSSGNVDGGTVEAKAGKRGREGAWVRSAIEGAERRERRTVNFEGKVYVAPLTTVGNLPFRRVMKAFGADITCGEMALANQILKGHGSEWALLRRHPCEDVFGVQVAGAHPDQMARLAELLENHAKVDFVDINMGCPIDLVCEKGMGAALMGRTQKLRGIISGMTSQLSCPLTVKMRVGWDEKKPNADTVVRVVQREADRCRKRGFPGSVAHVMIHGRSRLQRYSKLADWSYVRQVAASQDTTVPLLPVIGNGDILSWRDHEERLEQAMREFDEGEVVGHRRWSTCCMLARGALIKPWLPTEVKEKRDWDISSSERLDIYRQFVHYGLEHWGSDQMGVNKTRRFLLEWLSFTCRYIPVGILEVLPQRINERPVPYNGRDELESLMCSQNPGDWIKICEMLLGPVPQDFEFVPKHKANSYAPQAAVSLA